MENDGMKQGALVTMCLTNPEALALAQLAKCLRYEQMELLCMDKKDAKLMSDAVYQLSTALKDAGFDPR